MAKLLVMKFNGQVPGDLKQLQELPGVGRKTANVIASVIYHQPFMPVDTHVFRVSKRLGLVRQNSRTPLEVEKQLTKHLPKEVISMAHHWLILHGRYVCLARKPKCNSCNISHFCRYFEKLKTA
jgi:endonuclease-3